MKRRTFIAGLAGAAAWPVVAHAQVRGKRPLVAFLMTGPAPSAAPYLAAFTQGMVDLGWVEGRDYVVIYRFSASDVARMPLLADELVRLEPGAVVTSSNAETIAIERATRTVPIVGTTIADPIRLCIAASYSRPGGNTTGIMITVDDLPTKLLELALEVVPDCRNIGTLASTAGQSMHFQRGNEATAAARLTIAPVPIAVNGPEELETAFETFAREKVQAVVVYIDPLLFVHRRRIFELAMMRKLPTICGSSSYVRGRWIDQLGDKFTEQFLSRSCFCGPDFERCKARRSTNRISDKTGVGDQFENRDGTWPHDPTEADRTR